MITNFIGLTSDVIAEIVKHQLVTPINALSVDLGSFRSVITISNHYNAVLMFMSSVIAAISGNYILRIIL